MYDLAPVVYSPPRAPKRARPEKAKEARAPAKSARMRGDTSMLTKGLGDDWWPTPPAPPSATAGAGASDKENTAPAPGVDSNAQGEAIFPAATAAAVTEPAAAAAAATATATALLLLMHRRAWMSSQQRRLSSTKRRPQFPLSLRPRLKSRKFRNLSISSDTCCKYHNSAFHCTPVWIYLATVATNGDSRGCRSITSGCFSSTFARCYHPRAESRPGTNQTLLAPRRRNASTQWRVHGHGRIPSLSLRSQMPCNPASSKFLVLLLTPSFNVYRVVPHTWCTAHHPSSVYRLLLHNQHNGTQTLPREPALCSLPRSQTPLP